MTEMSTFAKARKVNLDLKRYGTFAEIGAGQEVARHFFQAGKASQTIAKTMSAYDMTYSDEIYGKEKSGRYVCEPRLIKMLEKEYSLLERRLGEKRGADTCFFAFASTVATGSPETPKCHGWIGVRFQNKPRGPANDIILHVRMRDRHRLQQQEALGVLGVNLVESAFYRHQSIDQFLKGLVENLKEDQVAIDIIKVQGPDTKNLPQRRLNLELVNRKLVDAVYFNNAGEISYCADELYGKSLLLQRGLFDPLTQTHLDVMKKGLDQVKRETPKNMQDKVLSLFELKTKTQQNTTQLEQLEKQVEVFKLCEQSVLVSNMNLFYQTKSFLRRCTQGFIHYVMDGSKLDVIFDSQHYAHLEGGLLEGLGRLFDQNSKIFIYPHKTEKICLTARGYKPHQEFSNVYEHFRKNNLIVDISACDEADLYWHSADVKKMIFKNDKQWKKLVPAPAVKIYEKW